MKEWPEFDDNGDLPVGIHQATIDEVVRHFGAGSLQRRLVAQRLERIFKLAISTGEVARFIVFGSFVTAKPEPGDVDIFMLGESEALQHWQIKRDNTRRGIVEVISDDSQRSRT